MCAPMKKWEGNEEEWGQYDGMWEDGEKRPEAQEWCKWLFSDSLGRGFCLADVQLCQQSPHTTVTHDDKSWGWGQEGVGRVKRWRLYRQSGVV